jgi:hypothetical protein
MLVRRERKYTLFYRLITPHDTKEIAAMKKWNSKVEKAVGAVTEPSESSGSEGEHSDDDYSVASGNSSLSLSQGMNKKKPSPTIFLTSSNASSTDNRGRASTLPAAGKIRARRATPTPRLRQQAALVSDGNSSDGSAAEDGFNVITRPATNSGLLMQQSSVMTQQLGAVTLVPGNTLSFVKPLKAKDELVDVIRGIKVEKDIMKKNEAGRT